QVNETGLVVDKQEHLVAVAATAVVKNDGFVGQLVQSIIGSKPLLWHDLFAIPQTCPTFVGIDQALLAAPRLDNLATVWAGANALQQVKAQKDCLQVVAFWNHEEVGSETNMGAASSFFSDTLSRIGF